MASTWTPGRALTVERATILARILFPDEYAAGTDCRAEVGREGEPCNICAARNEAWAGRVAQVRAALSEAFGYGGKL